MKDNSKQDFIDAWPTGYIENWEVYGRNSGQREEVVVNSCLSPYYNPNHTVLEIGCGGGFWTNKYLSPNFKEVIALDLIPDLKFKHENIKYIEVPNKDYSCYGVANESIDFCWSFGVFCHLTIDACHTYAKAIYDKLKPGSKAVLYYSNNDRRPHNPNRHISPGEIIWSFNDLTTTTKMLNDVGFIEVYDLMPELFDTVVTCTKPKV